ELDFLPRLLRVQVESHAAQVAAYLGRRFLEREVEALFTAPAGRQHHLDAERRLPGARTAGDEDAAATVRSAAQQAVDARMPGRQSLRGRLVAQAELRNRQDAEPRGADGDRISVRAVHRAAILDDAQAAGRALLVHSLIEEHD